MADQKLPRNAYEIAEGETYVPFTHGLSLTEFSVKAVISGALLGMLFGMANTYLGLKAGLTISTSIPVAVLTVVVFKLLDAVGVRHSILELNISQTVGSASSSVASGVLFTIPALFIWGMPPQWGQLTVLAMSGGLIGVLFMIPLRRFLIKKEHGKLPYPEGMACAEVLVAAERGGRQASNVFWGIGIGMFFKLLTGGLKLFSDKFNLALPMKAYVATSVSPALIGVGYILGIRIATVMVAGSALAALAMLPLIEWWGQGLSDPFYPEKLKLIPEMTTGEMRDKYIRYIGAGAVAMGGIITLVRSVPTMIESFRLGVGELGRGSGEKVGAVRTDRDLSFRTVLVVLGAILLALTFVPGVLGQLGSGEAGDGGDYFRGAFVRGLAATLIAIFAFFFVTVSSRIVGLVGVTANPTSGMTIVTLLGTSMIFWLAGWTDPAGKVTALMVGTVVCIASSIAGDTSQDLKTGFVLGATPRFQQIGELAGVITSAGIVAWTISYLHRSELATGGLGGSELPAPQGVLMSLVIDGVMDQNLPWVLIFIGAAIASVAALLRVPPLPFAVGMYLPLYTMAAVFLGGLSRWALMRNVSEEEAERRREQGVLLGSGMVGGEGLTGVLLAIFVVTIGGGEKITGIDLGLPAWAGQALSILAIAAIVGSLFRFAKRQLGEARGE